MTHLYWYASVVVVTDGSLLARRLDCPDEFSVFHTPRIAEAKFLLKITGIFVAQLVSLIVTR
ncbi:hypothetical protein WN55_05046 [Dufourea novaeangliae]|uniref:Uncharacterized protein n=1 Tax=Dufourea novaeangliae TaxID=178035 RepID=A0A154PNN7_DUFNO|nr:hypothetical protein WN55_05046 [Dufourea novaeangliae]